MRFRRQRSGGRAFPKVFGERYFRVDTCLKRWIVATARKGRILPFFSSKRNESESSYTNGLRRELDFAGLTRHGYARLRGHWRLRIGRHANPCVHGGTKFFFYFRHWADSAYLRISPRHIPIPVGLEGYKGYLSVSARHAIGPTPANMPLSPWPPWKPRFFPRLLFHSRRTRSPPTAPTVRF